MTQRWKNLFNIYVDTNVLINYCTGQEDEVRALNYPFSIRTKERLFTSSLAIVQTITNLQTKKSHRSAFSRQQTIEILNKILPKLTIVGLTEKDLDKGFKHDNEDIEDNIHYVLSQKTKCDAILTNNIKDFRYFQNITLLIPLVSYINKRVY